MPTVRTALATVLAAALAVTAASSAHAASVTVYTSTTDVEGTDFQSTIGAHAFDSFSDLHAGDVINSSYSRTIDPSFGTVTYTALTHEVYSNTGSMSTYYAFDPLTLTFSSNDIYAVGGYFALTDNSGAVASSTLTIQVMSGSTEILFTYPGDPTFPSILQSGTYLGITSDVPITSVTIGFPVFWNSYATLDNLSYGSAAPTAAVPLPSSLFGAIPLCGLLFLNHRRKSQRLTCPA